MKETKVLHRVETSRGGRESEKDQKWDQCWVLEKKKKLALGMRRDIDLFSGRAAKGEEIYKAPGGRTDIK